MLSNENKRNQVLLVRLCGVYSPSLQKDIRACKAVRGGAGPEQETGFWFQFLLNLTGFPQPSTESVITSYVSVLHKCDFYIFYLKYYNFYKNSNSSQALVSSYSAKYIYYKTHDIKILTSRTQAILFLCSKCIFAFIAYRIRIKPHITLFKDSNILL